MTVRRSLVLGGGGLAGIAWQTGVLAALAEEGLTVTSGADLTVGTSAGATVAAQLASGLGLPELYRRQAEPSLQNTELAPAAFDAAALMETWAAILADTTDPAEARRRVGGLALAADTVPEEARRAVIADRLPAHTWPDGRLVLVTVDAHSGEVVLLDRTSGVGLVDAVAASCAVPGVWPPVTIGAGRYVDGGVRSSVNADLADGDRVLVLAPLPDEALAGQLAGLVAGGARVLPVTPDEASAAAFGANPLDPAVRTPAARAGLAQGRGIAAEAREIWQG
ncbi:patatin-like phospholipase family protein [Kitasatospora sp. NBC_01539]|uniref:patatin-like phospholipase family protein n=1 Tax=Kitasatospora sp. NBC_01539 TaxID=2903577 RepID=UPI0038601C3A